MIFQSTSVLSCLPWAVFGLTFLLAATLGPAEEAKQEWHPAVEFDLEGRGWTDASDTEAPFDRLPAHAKGKAPDDVWGLSKHSSGELVRFLTDAREVSVRWSLTSADLGMPHMPATGVSGVDLYRREADGTYTFLNNGRPLKVDNSATIPTRNASGERHEFLLYLPLYNGVRSLEISVPPGASIGKPAPRPEARRRPIVFYGTSITQGGCASRPGMAFVAILGRRLDWPVINLGFSGSGKMEPEMATLVTELDPALFVMDCVANMEALPPEEVEKRVINIARTIRKAHPQTPILFVGRPAIRPGPPGPAGAAQERAVKRLLTEGMPRLHLIGENILLGTDTEGTVDGSHPTDLGMMRLADALYPTLRAILAEKAL
jgi:lysophospholipase L1-like esterase